MASNEAPEANENRREVLDEPKQLDQKIRLSATAGSDVAADAVTPVYRTEVSLYLVSTGDDQGSTVEMKGYIAVGGSQTEFKIDYPKFTNYIHENGGLGRLVSSYFAQVAFAPAPFSCSLWEDDRGGAQWLFNNYSVNFQQQPQEADGGMHVVNAYNNRERRFVANLTYQVIKIA